VPFTLVAFHAHPDDESLLMGGTLARAAAEGHRVVLVTATDGSAGLTAPSGEQVDLGRRRLAELDAAAAVLGAARVVHLGFPDGGFGSVDLGDATRSLLGVLDEEGPDVLTGYDPAGGYGHPDHVGVHRVARQAALRQPGLVLLEATVDRRLVVAGARVVAALPGSPPIDLDRMRSSYLPASELTHRIDVRDHVAAKVAGLAAHASQQSGGPGFRTVTLLRRLPGPVARAVLGREWFREVGRAPGVLSDDVFSSCR
jgi:LmbE family N-acetylglucosaminyl deacetylase